MRRVPLVLILAFVSATSLQLAAASDDLAAKRGITPEDYLTFEFAGDPHLSPDGKVVAYVLTTIDQKKNRRQSSVWLVPVDGSSRPRRLSAEGFDSNTPRWSPSGKTLAYLSSRNPDASAGDPPRPQIYLLPTAGGEALALTKFKNGVQAYQWFPDETRIAAVSPSGPSDAVAPADRKSDVRRRRAEPGPSNYPASSLLRRGPPLSGALVLSASRLEPLCFFPRYRRSGSRVPYKSQTELRAA